MSREDYGGIILTGNTEELGKKPVPVLLSSSSYGSTAQVGPWPPLFLGFRNNNLVTGLDC
jgi:hypothetical protein